MGAAILALGTTAASAQGGSGFLGGIKVGKNAAKWELRLGASAYDTGAFSSQAAGGFNINGEVLAPSPDFLSGLGAPRPYIGTDIAVSDHPIDMFYSGLNWEAYLTRQFYLGFSLGGALDTKTRFVTDGGKVKDLGSHLLFHLQASAGFDLTQNITAQVYYNHFSNARLSPADAGLESVGARIGVRF
ncbi:MAG: acyloxyacyl hydrolase [Pararhizobium sp.]